MPYNPNTYPYYQCDEEDYDSGTPPEEQMATAPVQADETALGNQMLWFSPERIVDEQTITNVETRNGREYGLCNYRLNGQDFLYVVIRDQYDPDIWTVVG